MTNVTFVPNVTPIDATWLNDVNVITNGLTTPSGAALVKYSNGGTAISAQDALDVLFYGIANVRNSRWAGGADGLDTQTLFATNYTTDIASSPVTITQQTRAGLAINAALVALRAAGGGVLNLPKGIFPVWGYLEKIDFPLRIIGAGDGVTIIKNCDASPTNANGFGIFCVEPSVLSAVTFENLTLDGNAVVRSAPTGEFRCYPLAWYGKVRARMVNVSCLNSPIDCMMTAYANESTSSMETVNLVLSNSYRNTLSLVAGWNQQHTNILIEKAGKVYTGTNPKVCLDIEPNIAANTIRNITFNGGTVRDAGNQLLAGIWAGNVQFNGMTFEAMGDEWLFNLRGGEFTFNGGFLRGNPATRLNFARCENPIGTGEFSATEFVAMNDVLLDGCGFRGYGLNMRLHNLMFKNSLHPVIFEGSGTQQLLISNMKLINVIDQGNLGAGTYAAFAVKSSVEGYIEIDGLHVRIVASELPVSPAFTNVNPQHGIYFVPTPSATSEVKVSNVHVAGYYRKYPTSQGYTLNTGNYRDWNSPNLPPADTAGQTAGPGAIRYHNCSAYGDSA